VARQFARPGLVEDVGVVGETLGQVAERAGHTKG
jgi:hypothetical protein